jgi:DNA polymerase
MGEAPGENEAKVGLPFIGKSGRFLRRRLDPYIDLNKDAYIINTVLCRPPGNRQPAAEEVKACTPHILTVILTMRPKLIITAGKSSSQWLTDITGIPYEIYAVQAAEIKIANYFFAWLPLYHPSYVMRSREQTQRFEKVLESYKNLFKNVDML